MGWWCEAAERKERSLGSLGTSPLQEGNFAFVQLRLILQQSLCTTIPSCQDYSSMSSVSDSLPYTPFHIGGLSLDVYNLPAPPTSPSGALPISVLFWLHGRTHSKSTSIPQILPLVEYANAKREEKDRHLVIVSFDQRNHGERTVDTKANESWSNSGRDLKKEGKEWDNKSHAVDMYAIQSASSPSFLPSSSGFVLTGLYGLHSRHSSGRFLPD